MRPLAGEVAMPGDKSISHRALLAAAAGDGVSEVRNLSTGADVQATQIAVQAFGVSVDRREDGVEVHGGGWRALREPRAVIDAGNSGTTIRTLCGFAAGVAGLTVLSGDESVRRRPMKRVVEPLRKMGATIDGRRNGDRAPLVVRGGELSPIEHRSEVASAQVKTAVLLAGLRARGATVVIEPVPSRDHTEQMLGALGVPITIDPPAVTVTGPVDLPAAVFDVPGDVSAAAFFVVAATLVPGSELTIPGVGLNPTRTGFLDVLRRMGAAVEAEIEGDGNGEPRGTITASYSGLHATTVEAEEIPRLVDEVPALAIAAACADGETVVRGVGELRVKESDRIAALVDGLRGLGVEAEADGDELRIRGAGRLVEAEVDSRGDHRIAMAFAVAGLLAEGRVRIKGWSSVATSFPEFLDRLMEAQRRGR